MAENGKGTSDEEGLFAIPAFSRIDFENDVFYKVGLKVSKQSVNTTHQFLCDEEANLCPIEYITTLQHLEFDKKITFVDNTSVPIKGTIFIDDTGGNCKIRGVEVCLLRKVGERMINTNTCTNTDDNGDYSIPATIGTHVMLDIQYHNHSFAGKSNESFTLLNTGIFIEGSKKYFGYDFYDTQKTSIILEV